MLEGLRKPGVVASCTHKCNLAHSLIIQRQLEQRKASQDFVDYTVLAHAHLTRIHVLHVIFFLQIVFNNHAPQLPTAR